MAVSQFELDQIYRDVLGDFRDDKEFQWKHRGGFVHFIQSAIDAGLVGAEFGRKNFKLERLSYELDPDRDLLLSSGEVNTLAGQLLRDGQDKLLETPQYYWMRKAMAESLDSPNPTRAALTLYGRYSHGGAPAVERSYGSDIFNNQRLLFDVTRRVSAAGTMDIPRHYTEHGWTVIDDIADEYEAIAVQERFLNSVGAQTQLAKADQIPVCDDIVATSFQVLHFDMGHPLVESADQLFVSHVGVYLPKATAHEVTAATRVVELDGLLSHLNLPARDIERKLLPYVREHGDGWEGHNTYRLAAFVRFLDAMSAKPVVQDQIDKTVGQWFGEERASEKEAYQAEAEFFAKHGITLDGVEHQVKLKPGQLLLLDNTRVIHGRIGRRREKELFNFMWGVKAIGPEDIKALRRDICAQLVTAR